MIDLHRLALDRIRELGQEAFTLHEDLMRWREKPLDDVETTKISSALKSKLEEQRRWINALQEEIDDD